MKPEISFSIKLWLFSLPVAPAIAMGLHYLNGGLQFETFSERAEWFLAIGIICGIGNLVLVPVFVLILQMVKRMNYPPMARIIFFLLTATIITTIILNIISWAEGGNWGRFYFRIKGIVIQGSYLIAWTVYSFLSIRFFSKMPNRKRNLQTLDEIPGRN